MRALFIDKDPVVRGHIQCLSSMVGLDACTVASAREAMVAILQGEALGSEEPWSHPGTPERIGVVVLDPSLSPADMPCSELLKRIRTHIPEAPIFAHGEPEAILGGESFDRVFFKPIGLESAVRAATGVVGDISERDLLHQLLPDTGTAA